MGYYTDFILHIYGSQKEYDLGEEYMNQERIKQIAIALAKTESFDMSEVEVEQIAVFNNPINAIIHWDSLKWYDHDDDMKAISLQFPDLYFVLYGDGEEQYDIWRSFYHNGSHVYIPAKIVFDEPPEDFWAEGNN